MTSPALVVLTLALVCSTYGTAMGQTADQASEHAVQKQNRINNMAPRIRPRTNPYNYIVNSQVEHNPNYKEHDYNNNNIYYQNGISKFGTNSLDNVDEIKSRIKSNIFQKSTEESPHKDEKLIFYNKREVNLESNKYTQRDLNIETEERINSVKNKLNDEEHKHPKITETKYIHFGSGGVRHFLPNVEHDRDEFNYGSSLVKRRVKREDKQDPRCEAFQNNKKITHPYNASLPIKTYYSQLDCVHVIEAKEKEVIKLTFVDVFHIEEHPKCAYDYLEIRNGQYGFSKLMGKYCGEVFPPTLTSTGPFMWLKFKTDETIEYEGFTIKVEFISSQDSYRIPSECYIHLKDKPSGLVDLEIVQDTCIEKSKAGNHGIDLLFNITTEENTDINLDFTQFELAKPNECEENIVEVYGFIMEEEKHLARYCGSAANALSTRPEGKPNTNRGNIMYVHIYMSQSAHENTHINATYTAFRTLDPMKDEKCTDQEFNCDDNTCISETLKCDNHAHCRLKADEDVELCKNVQESLIKQPHIMVILVIFSLILSGMSFVFLFKCIRKLYQDHKAIKEHIRQSTEDRLDSLVGEGDQILSPGPLTAMLRASLERENHANEYFKQQRGLSQHKGLPQQTSIDSDFQETHLDLDDEPWRREVDAVPEPHDKKAERNGRTRRSDVSKKEENLRSRKESVEEKKEIRDAAVGAPDTKESGCQTRESLFQADTAPSSDGSNSASNSRGFSTFGYSGATLARPSPPAPAPPPMISSTQIELLRQLPSLDGSYKSQKKFSDRRPMSAETTRSAPDVIIVSKPIR